jgi:hypothetical protein
MNSIDNTPPRYRHAVARRHCHLTLPVRVFWFLTPPLFSFFPFKYPQQGSQLPGTPIRPSILCVGLLRPPSSSPRLKANAHVSSRLLNATGSCHFISWSAWSGTVLWATPASPVPWALAGHLTFATSVIVPSDQAGQWSRRCISGCDEGVRQKKKDRVRCPKPMRFTASYVRRNMAIIEGNVSVDHAREKKLLREKELRYDASYWKRRYKGWKWVQRVGTYLYIGSDAR